MSTTPIPANVQAALFTLFELFTSFVAARTKDERAVLQERILALFSTLGVASDYPEVRRAVETFERLRGETSISTARLPTLKENARDIVNARLRLFERTTPNPKLSGAARSILRIPVIESVEILGGLNEEEVVESLDTVLDSLKGPPVSKIEGTRRKRTSIAVIRSLYLNFCNIPPFCAGK
jgi:hypothetical protein